MRKALHDFVNVVVIMPWVRLHELCHSMQPSPLKDHQLFLHLRSLLIILIQFTERAPTRSSSTCSDLRISTASYGDCFFSRVELWPVQGRQRGNSIPNRVSNHTEIPFIFLTCMMLVSILAVLHHRDAFIPSELTLDGSYGDCW